jgi:hypothetical protein
VAGQAGWQVPDPAAEGVRVGVVECAVVQSGEACPRRGVGGDVRGEDPAGVDLPGRCRFRAPEVKMIRRKLGELAAAGRPRTW